MNNYSTSGLIKIDTAGSRLILPKEIKPLTIEDTNFCNNIRKNRKDTCDTNFNGINNNPQITKQTSNLCQVHFNNKWSTGRISNIDSNINGTRSNCEIECYDTLKIYPKGDLIFTDGYTTYPSGAKGTISPIQKDICSKILANDPSVNLEKAKQWARDQCKLTVSQYSSYAEVSINKPKNECTINCIHGGYP